MRPTGQRCLELRAFSVALSYRTDTLVLDDSGRGKTKQALRVPP
jgi:hypothetical protein